VNNDCGEKHEESCDGGCYWNGFVYFIVNINKCMYINI
jgi:hypothetical protein